MRFAWTVVSALLVGGFSTWGFVAPALDLRRSGQRRIGALLHRYWQDLKMLPHAMRSSQPGRSAIRGHGKARSSDLSCSLRWLSCSSRSVCLRSLSATSEGLHLPGSRSLPTSASGVASVWFGRPPRARQGRTRGDRCPDGRRRRGAASHRTGAWPKRVVPPSGLSARGTRCHADLGIASGWAAGSSRDRRGQPRRPDRHVGGYRSPPRSARSRRYLTHHERSSS